MSQKSSLMQLGHSVQQVLRPTVSVTVYVTDTANWPKVNQVYAEDLAAIESLNCRGLEGTTFWLPSGN